MAIEDAISLVSRFKGGDLTGTVGRFEGKLCGADIARVIAENSSGGISRELLMAAADVKQASAQIDVVIHAAGILFALPYILQPGEIVENVSLGAGNAGSDFDLETDQRIAEFKFIHWQGGAEAMRKKTLFQDFYKLAREQTRKKKILYLLNTDIPRRFLAGNRQIRLVLDRNRRLADDFEKRYSSRYRTVGEYYQDHRNDVQLVNLVEVVPGFQAFAAGIQAAESAEELEQD